MRFQVGDRVTLSLEARLSRIHPRTPSREGTVTGTSIRHQSVYVRWDGRKTAEDYDESFLDLVSRPGA